MHDELRLLRKMARRDRSAWAIMYDRYVGDVFGLVYHLLRGDRRTAEDVCQEVWLLAIEQFEQYNRSRGEFRAWVLGIARHRVFHHHRRTAFLCAGPSQDRPTEEQSALEVLEEAERAGVVRAALLCLNEERRRVLYEKYSQGLSIKEIADRSGRSAKAVESLLSRARAELRELLRPYVFRPAEGECHEPSDVRSI
jgi:RNA polymerase sigma-70 factor (ECF subfamily)